mgnify:CR=1 FL=1
MLCSGAGVRVTPNNRLHGGRSAPPRSGGSVRREGTARGVVSGSWVGPFVLALLMLAVPLAVGAQPTGKVARIGIFGDKAADASEKHLWQVFRDGLREHGWSEGANLAIEYRWAEGNAARLPELAAQLVRLKPDVIVTRGSLFTGALKAGAAELRDNPRARSAVLRVAEKREAA